MSKKYTELEVGALLQQSRREAAQEAQQIGFELGKQAQQEQYSLSEKPISKEAEHTLNCPSCTSTIHIPCVNYTLANLTKVNDLQPSDGEVK